MANALRFDGGMIGVTRDRQAAIDWYVKHLGLVLNWNSAEEQMAHVLFPGGAAVTLKTLPTDQPYIRETNIRFCWSAPDLHGFYDYLRSQAIDTSDIEVSPDGRECFDFLDLEGTRMTAVAMPELAEAFPRARLVHYAPPRIGVSDLERALAWYERFLGLAPLAGDLIDGPVLISGGETDLPLMLEKLPEEAFEEGRQDGTTRPFFVTPDIKVCHRDLAEAGNYCSVIEGAPNALAVFHTYDPDGNRINIWSYPE